MAAAIYAIATVSLLGVVLRPFRSPEVVWAVAGAALLVFAGFVPWPAALGAMAKGIDVYLFLIGMMLLSALAEREGFFDYLAALCVVRARGSASRLFLLIYAVGTLVTALMSNDATAVVLTPAVLAVCRKAKARPLPYLLGCALIANAASFVLPLSNPANLVVFGDALPPLTAWVGRFLLPSLLSIVATYAMLRWQFRRDLDGAISEETHIPSLTVAGILAAAGIALMAGVLIVASAFGVSLGLPALLAATSAWFAVSVAKREAPWRALGHVSWSIVPLVAGLFVLVEGLRRAGLLRFLTAALRSATAASPESAALGAGAVVAFACNLMNNLPAGLVAGSVVAAAGSDRLVQSAVAIGIDL
ncbi:MAG: SLC13 family permease, partial [Caldimonas sp.]